MTKYFIILIFFTGCATVDSAFMRDGQQVYEAHCEGLGHTIAVCHELASKKCDGHYKEMGGEPGGLLRRRTLLFVCQ